LSHLIADSYSDGKYSEKEHIVDISLFYDNEYVGKPMNLKLVLNKSYLDKQILRKAWIGLHRHVFEAESFEHKILSPILYSGYVDLRIKYCDKVAMKYGEFYCVLEKNSKKQLILPNYINFSEKKNNGSPLHNRLLLEVISRIKRVVN
jgi:hypothetical protein